jgi:hypothetical protein
VVLVAPLVAKRAAAVRAILQAVPCSTAALPRSAARAAPSATDRSIRRFERSRSIVVFRFLFSNASRLFVFSAGDSRSSSEVPSSSLVPVVQVRGGAADDVVAFHTRNERTNVGLFGQTERRGDGRRGDARPHRVVAADDGDGKGESQVCDHVRRDVRG